LSTPGASDDERRQGAARIVWIAPALAVAAMAALIALTVLDTHEPRRGGGEVELKLPAAAADEDARPEPGLVEDSPEGKLPIIGKDGRQPWQVYAGRFDAADTRPRLALVVEGLGLDATATRDAIARLPAAVTLGFSPYAHDLAKSIGRARRAGHEVLMGVPLEPADYPREDPGPYTLLTSLDPQQNLARLKTVMGRGAAYAGLLGVMGDRFVADKASLEPMLEAVKARGLLFVDDHDAGQSAFGPLARALGMAWALAQRRIDADASAAGVDKALGDLAAIAVRDGAALGLGGLYPVTLDRILAFAPTLAGKGVMLAPASAVAMREKPPS
jgi:uncharacterized protein